MKAELEKQTSLTIRGLEHIVLRHCVCFVAKNEGDIPCEKQVPADVVKMKIS